MALLAPGGGEVESSSGFRLSAEPLRAGPFDTVIASGGDVARSRAALGEVVAWLRRTGARRTASVCSGAYLLAEAGLLDGRSATTHWGSTGDFGRRYPRVKLDAERIFIRDGDVWTSAGISAGVGLALALVEDDLGRMRRAFLRAFGQRHRPCDGRPGPELDQSTRIRGASRRQGRMGGGRRSGR